MRAILVVLLIPALIACGDGADQGSDGAFREGVARRFDVDCRRTRAPDPAAMRDLARLCDCTQRGIRDSDISARDGEDAITGKVRRVEGACLAELYGEEPAAGNASR